MKILRYCITFLIAWVIFGTSFASTKEVARIDGFVITDSDLKQRIGLLSPNIRNRVKFDKERFLNKLIDEELLVREAKKLNLHEREDFKLRVETFQREFLVDLYLQKFLDERNTEANQKKYYEENKANYKRPEMLRISDIRTESEDEAKEILKRAKGGEDFGELARKYSKGAAADKGGDYGFRAKEMLRKEFANVASSMKKGEISDPFKTQDGYHIIKLTDRKEAGIVPFEDVKNRVADEYAKKILGEKISELRKAVTIHIDSATLENLKID
jgi:peptidyl-prolyl cis-trans isomerase C